MGFWHTNRSLNLSQTTRPYNNEQKNKNKKTCKIVDFAVPADDWIKLKVKRRISTRTLLKVSKVGDQDWLAKGLGLGLLCSGFKGVQEEIPREEASTLQIGSVAFPAGQCTSSQLHPCHRLFDQDGHQDISSPSLSSRACSLWLLVIPQAQSLSLWDNWGDERGCDEGHWHAHTRGLPWGLPEVVVKVQQVHCSRRRLLRRGLEFHVCTINKSSHTKKVWKLI